MEKEVLDLIIATKAFITALTIAVICWGMSKILPGIADIADVWRKRKTPDTYVTYNDCIFERGFDKEGRNRFS